MGFAPDCQRNYTIRNKFVIYSYSYFLIRAPIDHTILQSHNQDCIRKLEYNGNPILAPSLVGFLAADRPSSFLLGENMFQFYGFYCFCLSYKVYWWFVKVFPELKPQSLLVAFPCNNSIQRLNATPTNKQELFQKLSPTIIGHTMDSYFLQGSLQILVCRKEFLIPNG